MDALVGPVPAVDPVLWGRALDEAKAKLAGLAVRRAGTARFRVTDHEVRTAFSGHDDGDDPGHADAFAWTARTARRSIGVAAVRLLVGGRRGLRSRRCGTAWPSPPAGCAKAVPRPPSSTGGWTASRPPAALQSARRR